MRYFFTIFFSVFFVLSTMAQSGSIRGTVLRNNGKPIVQASILLIEEQSGTISDNFGEFKFDNIEAGEFTLKVSYIGMMTVEKKVIVEASGNTDVDFILEPTSLSIEQVVVRDNRGTRYSREESDYVAKMPLKNIENPQAYSTVTEQLLKEQNVTNFDDALKNAPGVSKLWESTGRGGDGAGYFSMRGFSIQPTLVNGLPGLTNGSLDPANIERIEVLKGPSGTLFGSSLVSYGGLINTVTKKPYKGFGGEASFTMGSFGLNRITADVNTPLGENKEIVLRVNTAFHSETSFQDAGFKKSFFVAPTLAYTVNEKLSFLVSGEFLSSEGTNQTMLFLNRSSPLEYDNMEELNYNPKLSLTSNEISIRNPRYNLNAKMSYKLSDSWTSQTVVSRGSAQSSGYYTYLWDAALTTGDFELYLSDQNANTLSTDIQQNLIGDFNIGTFRNRMVIGLDYFNRNSITNSSGYVWVHNVTPQGEVNYINYYTGDTLAPRYLSRQSIDGLLENASRNLSNTREEIYSAYLSDVINITPSLSVMASLRVDHFINEGSTITAGDGFSQTALSPKFGVIYQQVLNQLSLFANYQNGFNNVAPRQVADVDGNNPRVKTFTPEQANQWEVGMKTHLFADILTSTISYYNINVFNKVLMDPSNPNNSIQGGEVESRGFEVDLVANPFPGLNLIMGYGYNQSEVIEGPESSTFEEEGKRPGEAGPKNLFNAWATYRFQNNALRNFGVGFGANSASELLVMDSEAIGRFIVPSYTVLNASLFYNHEDFEVTLKLDNLANKEYYKGWSTINPQMPRRFSASLRYTL
ncbi:TonB-dependent receptor [Membranihabitans maritimus]|uniref:TonB-dependent receptor n=1 Tax=Membranihabitans maritimus TaxID=2904244 RepID=UPI001F3267D0|nr:TonB-dependent receptor [Membranihabitans maritimus]